MRILGGLLGAIVAVCIAATAMAADLATLVANLVEGGYSERDAAITALPVLGPPVAKAGLPCAGPGRIVRVVLSVPRHLSAFRSA